jgi:hypothetical protein
MAVDATSRILGERLTRGSLAGAALLKRGRFANADVLVAEVDGVKWLVKDFAPRSALVRWTIGLFFTRREFRALRRCDGLQGTPPEPRRIDALAFAYRFIEGRPLKSFAIDELDGGFFYALEEVMRQVHARRIVHLDIRNRRNVLRRTDGQPVLIDFQSSLSTRFFPRPLRRLVEESDMSGVYKHWIKYSPSTLDEGRREFVERVAKLRWLWVFRGYAGFKPRRSRPHAALESGAADLDNDLDHEP